MGIYRFPELSKILGTPDFEFELDDPDPSQCKNYSFMLGKKHTEESKRSMSINTSGPKNPMYGKKHSPETRAKIKAKRALQITTEETRIKMSKAKKGRSKSDETRLKMKGNRNALGSRYSRTRYGIIAPDGHYIEVDGARELEQYVPYWVSKMPGVIVQGKYKGWRAYPIKGGGK